MQPLRLSLMVRFISRRIQQIKREKSSEKRQQMIVQVLELMTIIL
jgi:hypothetical protein